ncbi:MAG: efflux RND transporter periplasmic adaptor subunit [Pseudomonadota bacterium]
MPNFDIPNRVFLTIGVFALALTGVPSAAQQASTAPAEAAAPALPAITVTAVSKMVLKDRVLASGLIGPVEQVQVQPLIEGQPIETLEVDVSDTVVKDQVLARLSKTSLDLQESQFLASMAAARATIAQAEASRVDAEATAAEARRVAERTAKLRQQGSATQAAQDTAQAGAISAAARVAVAVQTLEAARAQLALAEAQLDNVRLQLSRTEIRSPVAGEVLERNALIGSIATAAGQPMFVIMKDGALEVRADLAEADLFKVAVGQKAELRFGKGETTVPGTVRLVEPAIDTTTRLGRARIAVDAKSSMRSGVFVEAEIIVAEHEALAVPLTAVSTTGGVSTVMRVKDGTVEEVPVTIGIRARGMVEIASGLAEGDQVVLKAGSFVRNGDKINPVMN